MCNIFRTEPKKKTRHLDSTAEMDWKADLDDLIDDMGDYEWDPSVEDEVYTERIDRDTLEKFVRKAIQQVLQSQREEIEKAMIEITEDGYDCICKAHVEDYFNDKLDKLK